MIAPPLPPSPGEERGRDRERTEAWREGYRNAKGASAQIPTDDERAKAAAPTTVESCHAAHVVVHTYDGPAATEFCFDDFQYTGADVFLIGHEDGDGIFHDGFEVAR